MAGKAEVPEVPEGPDETNILVGFVVKNRWLTKRGRTTLEVGAQLSLDDVAEYMPLVAELVQIGCLRPVLVSEAEAGEVEPLEAPGTQVTETDGPTEAIEGSTQDVAVSDTSHG